MSLSRAAVFRLAALAAALVLTVLAGLAAWTWRWRAAARDADDFEFARELLTQGRAEEALRVTLARMRERPENNPELSRWLELHVWGLEQLGHAESLREIYYRAPPLFAARERAALLAARALAQADDEAAYETLRESWRGRETRLDAWRALETDWRLARGDIHEAEKLLADEAAAVAVAPPGAAHTAQSAAALARLAVLRAGDPDAAWRTLEQAAALAPDDSTIRLFRGQFLEAHGRLAAARGEYEAAWGGDARRVAERDQLAEFYCRQGEHEAAVATWLAGAPEHSADHLELKALFWSRVAFPADAESLARLGTPGPWAPLVTLLQAAPPDRFWNDDAFWKLPGAERLARVRQEVSWLALLDNLAVGNESGAETRLRSAETRANAWAPELRRALRLVLAYRRAGRFDPLEDASIESPADPGAHAFLAQLNAWHAAERALARGDAPPESTSHAPTEAEGRFLRGDDALPTLCVVVGWREAGLRLKRCPVGAGAELRLAPEAPTWAVYAWGQTLRFNRGLDPALAFLQARRGAPEIELLIGECLVDAGRFDEAARQLEAPARAAAPVGERAAWLRCLALLELGRLDEANALAAGHTGLRASPLGQEIQGRVAYARGDLAAAEALYRPIQEASIEAKAFLARRAFAARNWNEAESLTRELLRALPNHPELRQNLAEIAAARAGG